MVKELMDQIRVVRSPAKINVHLEVGARQQNGYHELCSLMLMADFCDTLTVRLDLHGEGFSLTSYPDILPEENTLSHAWNLFSKAAGVRGSCAIALEKSIPPGSGLAGGSGNAAALLSVLNNLYGFPLPAADLIELAGLVGSDVPFFLSAPACLVRGVGDVLTPLEVDKVYQIVIVLPSIEISTQTAYAMLDEKRSDPFSWEYRLTPARCAKAFLTQPPVRWPFLNSFEPVITGMHPCYDDIRSALKLDQQGFAVLTGSGSAMVGIYPESCDLKEIIRTLAGQQHRVVLTKTLAISPFGGYNVH